MMASDEDALICDFAETYHILDYKALPLTLRATLASGLRDSSRSKLILNGRDYTITDEVLMHIYDLVHWIQWSKTEDGSKNLNHPQSIFELMSPDDESDYASLTPDDLMKALYG